LEANPDKPTVVIEDSIVSENVKKLNEIANVITLSPYSGVDKWKEAVKNAIAIVDRKTKISKEIMDAAPKLRLIARTGIGVDETRIDLEEAKRRKIVITYNPGINSDSVAELTVLLVLAIFRKLLVINKYVREADWARAQSTIGNNIKGRKWGIIGFGNAGNRVANLVKTFGCEIYAYDPFIDSYTILSRGANPLSLEQLLGQCDIISIHVPLTNFTKHLIGEKEIKLMKNTSILVNVSRGGIVDDHALYKALRADSIMGAGLDTLEDEPIHKDNPLLSLDNVVITPHIGGSTHEGIIAGAELAVEEVLRLINGLKPLSLYKFE